MKLLKNTVIVLAIIVAFLLLNSTNIFAKTVIVDTDTLKLRKEPSTDSSTLELLNKGEELEYIDETDEWYKVKSNGNIGYVHKDYSKLKEEDTSTKTTELVTTETANTEIENTVNTNSNTNINISTNINTNVDTETNEQIILNTEIKISRECKIYILPLINSNIIGSLKKDENVIVISKANGWVYIETSSINGWIRKENLSVSTVTADDEKEANNTVDVDEISNTINDETEASNNNDEETTQKTMYVNTSSIYVRKGPGTTYEILDSLILNDIVTVTAENGDWYKVSVNGQEGYIAKRLLSDSETQTTSRGGDNERIIEQQEIATETTTTDEVSTTTNGSSKGNQIVEYAKQYLGCKYVYGAAGPSTFDCSGFTMYVFKNFGITLSHSATAQSKVGTYVAKEDLQPGDLVFFTDYETGSGIGHCGIYVGDGNFIHASSGTGYCVKISTLTSGSYLKRYETARRVI
jgi:N-acetylmuramoyl-L-alanine amidase